MNLNNGSAKGMEFVSATIVAGLDGVEDRQSHKA